VRASAAFVCALAAYAAFGNSKSDRAISERLARDASATLQARAAASSNGWVRHRVVAEQDLPAIDSECSGYGLQATVDLPTRAELEAAYAGVAPYLATCLQGHWTAPFEIAVNIDGATGSIAGAAFAALKHADMSGAIVDHCLRRAFARVCVHPFETPHGHPYIAWLFDERRPPEQQPAQPARDSLVERDSRRIFPEPQRGDWCGTGINMDERRRMHDEKAKQKELQQAFFATWTPVEAPRDCADLAAASATRELRYPRLGGATADPAGPLLTRCMRAHGVRGTLPIALEMDLQSGCVTRAMARVEPRKPSLDRCVARALSHAFYTPGDHGRELWWTHYPLQAEQHVDATARTLVAVRSRCPGTPEQPRGRLPRSEWAVPHEAVEEADSAIYQCVRDHTSEWGLEVAINFHAPTGHAVSAAAITKHRNPKLDACIARALATTCLPPSSPRAPGAPYFSIRHRVFVPRGKR
jgi:hypothetical protein